MKKKTPCPYKALLIIANNEKNTENTIISILNKYNITTSMISSAQGTAPSTISDFFGFGIIDKIVFSTFIPASLTEKIIENLQTALQTDDKNKGMIITLPITALSSNVLEIWRIKNESKASKTTKATKTSKTKK